MSAIFYHDEEQRNLAEKTRDAQQQHLVRPIVTTIARATPFYEAENYHQKYILRQHPTILDKLGLSDSELVQSSVACRLNGYLEGFGCLDDFNKEQETFGLPEASLSYIRKQIEKKQPH
ncbi:hypothetical protein DPMN_179839 [Dreissena polymorpha]|uniref:peptide-methionine (S)-S-oxide reductase n=2 Tax=Dreissena polymorpha TaxID=45954 RepID=A0A9D4INV7_DREPO|nr:hypothetical protein DPMN_179839 [Dreissena polymorpha]